MTDRRKIIIALATIATAIGVLVLAALVRFPLASFWQKITAPKIDYSFKLAPSKSGFSLLNENKRAGFSVLLAKSDNPKIPQARFEVESSWLEFGLHTSILNIGGETYKKTNDAGRDLMIWKNAIKSGDVTYQIKPDGLKEEIVLKDKSLVEKAIYSHEPLVIPFNLTTSGVKPKNDLSGKLAPVFYDSNSGEYRFHLEKPFMVDAKGVRYDSLEYELIPMETANSHNVILASEERARPGSVSDSGPASSRGEQARMTGDIAKRIAHYKILSTPSLLNALVQSAFAVSATTSLPTIEPEKKTPSVPKNTKSPTPTVILGTPSLSRGTPESKTDSGQARMTTKAIVSTYLLRYKLPRDWLADPNRAYPVIIDPTITHNTQTAFATGTLNRVKDEGSADASPLLTSSYHELAADINTIGLWHMNEASGNAADSSGNGNTGTPTGTTVVTGKFGNARSFNGTSDLISIANSASLNPSVAITIEAWIKRSATGVNGYWIVGKDDSASQRSFDFWTDSTNKLNALICQNAACSTYIQTNSTGTVADTNWHHVAMTFTASSNVGFYIDGVLDSSVSTTVSGIANSTSAVQIGARTSAANYFSGIIDDVRISNIARSPEEIRQDAQRFPYSVYTSPVVDLTAASAWTNLTWLGKEINTGNGETPISTTNLVAQWNFNETSGTTAASGGTCGATCNGTLTNFASTASQDQAAGTGWTANNKRWGAGALMFDGTNDYVSLPAAVRPGITNTYSMEAWVKRNKTGVDMEIMGNNNGAGGSGLEFMITSGNVIGCHKIGVTGGALYGVTTITDRNWHYVACTISSSGQTIYLDGKSDASNSNTSNFNDYNAPVFLGARNVGGTTTDQYFNGTIDSTRIYSRALSAAEILSNYQAGNIEFQTRTSADNSTWEAWKPVTNETAIASLDSDAPNWPADATNPASGGITKTGDVMATGGTITYSGGYTIHTFKSSGTFTPNAVMDVEVLVVGGGGGGGSGGSAYFGGGGGAGGYRTGTLSVTTQAYTITVGAGGTYTNSTNTVGGNGGNSVFSTITSTGGGGGSAGASAGQVGGSGGGGSYGGSGQQHAGGAGNTPVTTPSQGNNGGNYTTGGQGSAGGGAGGAASGLTAGPGTASSISDSSVTYATGGTRESGGDATANTGNGGRGGRTVADGGPVGGAGGSGIVIIRYPTTTATKMEGTGALRLAVGSPQVDANTVGLWHMDETSGSGAYIKDATANANHGTPTGTSVVDGFYGKARSFNGTSDYITVAHSSSINFEITNPFSIEAWVKAANTSDSALPIVAKWANSSSGGYIFTIRNAAPNIDIALQTTTNGNRIYWRGAVGTSITKWNHYAMTYDGSQSVNGVKVYVNGSAISSSYTENNPLGSGMINTAALKIGADPGGFGYGNGTVDEVKISNVVRTAEEIAEAYRAGRDHRLTKTISSTDLSAKTKLPFYVASDRPGTFLEATVGESAYANYEPDANTVGLWHLEEQAGSGAYIKDSSSNANNGTPTGTTFVQGKIGKARSFNGSSDNIGLAAGSNADVTGDITVETWINPSSFAATQTPIHKDYQYTFDIDTSGNVAWADSSNYSYANFGATNIGLVTGQWQHLAFTKTGGVVKIYLNGILQSSKTFGGALTSTANIMRIGCYANASACSSQYFNGQLDEVRISNTARTADDIRQAYEIGKRTHPITIDFVSKPQAAYSSGTSVTILNPFGTTNLTDTLKVGDTMIFKENVGGTETVSQAVVSAIANTTSTYGTVTLASAPSFPSGGYTTNATVFKWQREYFDLTGSLASQRDAITRLTMRVTDGSQGANVWLDDFRSSGGYINLNTPTSFDTATGIGTYTVAPGVTSTLNRYFQYRGILSSWDTLVSPQLTSVQLNYVSNNTPTAPTISAPTNGATGVAATPSITISSTDADSDYIRYKIQIATDAAFSQNLSTFDQTVSQTGWSGQNAQTGTAYNSGSNATYTIQSSLLSGKRYFIRAYATDPNGSNIWSSASSLTTFLRSGVVAGPCTSQPGGDFSVDEGCSYTGSSEGVEAGDLTVKTGSTFTLNANQSIVWNPGQAITIQPGASIAINSSSKLTQSYMYTPSSGTSGYPDPIGFAGASAVYHMDDALGNTGTSGTTIFSSTGSNNGTATGTSIVSGKFGNARSFNGTSDYISIGALSGTVQAVGFWVNPNSTTGELIDLNGTAYIKATSG
ncbi:LamG domain-containing protein, partial [Candidatus Gottesmanbacteria bacterium]|nr:LamG domain-containing protein [Candidatus Gottesmanbacteria bacterium]